MQRQKKSFMAFLTLLIVTSLSSAFFAVDLFAAAVGEKAGGGVVFFVDPSGQHGLIAAESDLAAEADWYDASETCRSSFVNGYSGWYLPSRGELEQLYRSRALIGGLTDGFYWSSSEFSNTSAWLQMFSTGGQYVNDKNSLYRVRPIRAF